MDIVDIGGRCENATAPALKLFSSFVNLEKWSFPKPLGRKSADAWPRMRVDTRLPLRFTSISAAPSSPRGPLWLAQRANKNGNSHRWLPRRHFGTKAIIPRRIPPPIIPARRALPSFSSYSRECNDNAKPFRRRSQGSSSLTYKTSERASERACSLSPDDEIRTF